MSLANVEEGDKKPRRRIMILLSDTGGGHRASAKAVEDALQYVYGFDSLDIVTVDLWSDHGTWPYSAFVPVYRFASENPWFWRVMYEQSKSAISRSLFFTSGYKTSGLRIGRILESFKPDLLISVHPLCQHVPLQVLNHLKEAKGLSAPPLVTIVTDLGGAHPTWFHPQVTRTYVPSIAVRNAALAEGISDEKLRHFGLPLRRQFWAEPVQEKRAIRFKLKLQPDWPTALIVGGGEGVGQIDELARAAAEVFIADSEEVQKMLAQEGQNFNKEQLWSGHDTRLQLVIVCGKNIATLNKVVKSLNALCLKFPKQQIVVEDRSKERANVFSVPKSDGKCLYLVVYGFSDEMDSLMTASDILVSKAGPGTIAEATTRGLPVLLTSYLPGQEEGNVDYVLAGRFGAYCDRHVLIGFVIREWLTNPNYKIKMRNMSIRARAASNATASIEIAADLSSFIPLPPQGMQ